MPRKNGIVLIRELKAIRPSLGVVAMSGNLACWQDDLDGVASIPKPFKISMLLSVLQSS